MKILNENPLALGVLKYVGELGALMGIEYGGMLGIGLDKQADTVSDRELQAKVFLSKYSPDISHSQSYFFDIVEELVNFQINNSPNLSFFSNEAPEDFIDESIRESNFLNSHHKKIINSKYSLSSFLLEMDLNDAEMPSSYRYSGEDGLSGGDKLKTYQVKFKDSSTGREWKYIPKEGSPNYARRREIALSDYYILDGRSKLGEKQFIGDPFTYEELDSGKLKVISGPDVINKKTGKSFRDSIGKTFQEYTVDEDFNPDDWFAPDSPEEDKATDDLNAAIQQAVDEAAEEVLTNRSKKVLEQVQNSSKLDGVSVLPFLSIMAIAYPNRAYEPGEKPDIEAGAEYVANKMAVSIRSRGIVCERRAAMVKVFIANFIYGTIAKAARDIDTQLYRSDVKDPSLKNTAGEFHQNAQFRRSLARKATSIGWAIKKAMLDGGNTISKATEGPDDDLKDFSDCDICNRKMDGSDCIHGKNRSSRPSPAPTVDYDTTGPGGGTLNIPLLKADAM